MYEYDALKMIIADELLEELGTVNVDYRDSAWRSGFAISSSKPLSGSGGGGGCC